MHLKQGKFAVDADALALEAAHATAFHTGLGFPLYPSFSAPTKGLDDGLVAAFSEAAYAKSNFALVAEGTSSANLSKWVDHFFKDVPTTSSGSLSLNTTASKYYGGESRTGLKGANSMVIAFPGSSYGAFKPEAAVLAALIGGQSSIKWAPGFSLLSKAASPDVTAKTANLTYSDAGLLALQISGPAASIRKTAEGAVAALKSVAEGATSKEDLAKAIAKAKFDALETVQLRAAGLVAAGSGILHGGQPFQVADTAKSLDSVTAEKLKSVGLLVAFVLTMIANVYTCAGGQGSAGREGDGCDGWRSLRSPVCGGAGSHSLEGTARGRSMYQQFIGRRRR